MLAVINLMKAVSHLIIIFSQKLSNKLCLLQKNSITDERFFSNMVSKSINDHAGVQTPCVQTSDFPDHNN